MMKSCETCEYDGKCCLISGNDCTAWTAKKTVKSCETCSDGPIPNLTRMSCGTCVKGNHWSVTDTPKMSCETCKYGPYHGTDKCNGCVPGFINWAGSFPLVKMTSKRCDDCENKGSMLCNTCDDYSYWLLAESLQPESLQPARREKIAITETDLPAMIRAADSVVSEKCEPTGEESALNDQHGGEHYKKFGDYQPWQVAAKWLTPEELKGFMKGTVISYLAREADKGGRLDIEKAMHTMQIYLELSK